MNQRATIYDYARMCRRGTSRCSECPLNSGNNGTGSTCSAFVNQYPDKANEIILKWCKEHPVETRQDELLEVFPNADIKDGVADICVKQIDGRLAPHRCSVYTCCKDCKRAYWLEEVDTRE